MSTRAVILALFAAALGIALLAFGFLRSDEPRTGKEPAVLVPSASSDGPAKVAPQSPPVDAEPRGPRASMPLPQSGVPAPTAQAAPTVQGPRDAVQKASSSGASEVAEAERVFAAEAVDASWAPGMEATIYEQIGEIAGAELVTVNTECRTTLCRLQVTQRVPVQAGRSADESPAMYEMYETLFARLGFENRSVTSTAEGNGMVTSVVYLPRGDSGRAAE